jgi:hypothetical protein
MHITIFNYDKIKGRKKEKRTSESAKKREQESPQLWPVGPAPPVSPVLPSRCVRVINWSRGGAVGIRESLSPIARSLISTAQNGHTWISTAVGRLYKWTCIAGPQTSASWGEAGASVRRPEEIGHPGGRGTLPSVWGTRRGQCDPFPNVLLHVCRGPFFYFLFSLIILARLHLRRSRCSLAPGRSLSPLSQLSTQASPMQGFLYRPVYFYRHPAVMIYRSGINGIPLLTARIQILNQNRIYKQ